MMLGAILKKVEKLKTPLNPIMQKVMSDEDIQKKMIDKNQGQMFDKGVNAKGVSLGNYSPVSVSVYKKRPGHIQIFETGETYESMYVSSDETGTTIKGNTIKQSWDGAIDLEDRFGKLMGLTEESKSELMPEIKERFIEKFKEATGF